MKHLIIGLCFFSVALGCNNYEDFSINEEKCKTIEIISDNQTLELGKDTAWFVKKNDTKLFYCDKHKIETLFNVLRDFQIQGLSSYDEKSTFKKEIIAKNSSGKTIKHLKLNPTGNSMIGSCNNGKCFILYIPGLNQNPESNFSSDINYWKELSLLEINLENFSTLKIENFIDTLQSFSITKKGDFLEIYDYKNQKQSDISQENIKQFLGSVFGVYKAKKYLSKIELPENQKIYTISTYNQKISFYKKYNNGQPDFNQMYFSDSQDFGTVTYFAFEKLLVDLDYLRK